MSKKIHYNNYCVKKKLGFGRITIVILVSAISGPLVLLVAAALGSRPPPRSTAPLIAALAARCLAHLTIADHNCCAALLVAGLPLLRLEVLMERAH
jgi:hypothetical protein